MIKYLPLEVLATDNQSINQYIPSEPCDINICPNFPLRDTAPLKYITPLQTNFGMPHV